MSNINQINYPIAYDFFQISLDTIKNNGNQAIQGLFDNTLRTELFSNNPFSAIHGYQNQQCSCIAQPFEEYDTNISSLTKKQIIKRMLIVKNFLFNKKLTLEAISQVTYNNIENLDYIFIRNTCVYTRDTFCPVFNCAVSAGFWYQTLPNKLNNSIYRYGFDVISLHTFLLQEYNKQYSDSVEEIYDFFSTREFIHRSNSFSSLEFYIQEKNPISMHNPVFFDRFLQKFIILSITYIYNTHNRKIGAIWNIKTQYTEKMDIFYTFWRHNSGVHYSLFPLPPQPPYELYFAEKSESSTTRQRNVIICNSAEEFNTVLSSGPLPLLKCDCYNYTPALIYGGVESLTNANVSAFSGCTFHFPFKIDMKHTFLKQLYRVLKEHNITASVYFDSPSLSGQAHGLHDILNDLDKYDIERSCIKYSMITNPDTQIQGADRKRKMLLDPVIESGTITWLFAAEKAGKTILALSIAQAIGVGNSQIGTWRSLEPQKVLYIDGEMPGDKLQSHIEKIIRATNGDINTPKRAFSVFLFAESEYEYEYLLDDNWQKEYIDELMEFDLIILDNYYTLYDSLNPIKLIRWMKNLCRYGVAFLILDHTNSEGKLQGSIVKKRAMDLGIKIELLRSNNELKIDFESDRYGRQHIAKPFSLIPCFTSSHFSYEVSMLDKLANDSADRFSPEEMELIAILALKKQGLENKNVAEKLNISQSNVSKKLEKIGRDASLRQKRTSQQINKLYTRIEEGVALILQNDNEALENLVETLKNTSKH